MTRRTPPTIGTAALAALLLVAAPPAPAAGFNLRGEAASACRTGEALAASDAELAAVVERRWPRLRWSSNLARAAAAWGDSVVRSGGETEPMLAELAVHRTGSPDIAPVATLLGRHDAPAAALNELATVVATAGPPFTHVGVAQFSAVGRPPMWAAILVRRQIELEPVPLRAAPGATLHLVFRTRPELSQPSVVVGEAGRRPRRLATVRRDDGAWEAAVPLRDEPGLTWLVLDAEGPHGTEVVGTVPVAVGVALPTTVVAPPAALPADPEEALTALVNHDRLRFGLPSLEPDPALVAIARDHSADMAAHGFFAHESPRYGGLSTRLAAHGYAVRSAAENIAEARDAVDVETSLMASPGHRANILSPEATHVGVGVVRRQRPSSGLLVTQIFARPQGIRSADQLRRLLLGDPSGGPEPPSTALDEVAAALARVAAPLHRLPPDAMERARTGLAAHGISWSSLHLVYLEVSDIDAAGPSDHGSARVLGVGIAPPPPDRPSAPWTVVIVELR